jgi:L-threonylcarbamoyladenylate synthase
VALQVLIAFDRPLAAPSANRFGEVSPTTRGHVVRDLGDQVAIVLEGGASDVGVESTIVDLSSDSIRILRPGGVSQAEIESVLGHPLADNDGQGPVVPGSLEAHYAPRAEVLLLAQGEIVSQVRRLLGAGQRVGVFSQEMLPESLLPLVQFRQRGDGRAAAHDLYSVLRALDDAGCDVILATLPDGDSYDQAVADRLRRAAVGSRRGPK